MKRIPFSNRRSLRLESLESRALLAADLLLPHNFEMPEDSDHSGSISPLDALVVINELNRHQAVIQNPNSDMPNSDMLDVDADGSLSPLDALIVINYLNRQPADGAERPSLVPIEARIARLESAIASGQVPIALGIDGAEELLETLKNGGLPELGERFIDGHLHSRIEVEQIECDRIVSELSRPTLDGEHPDRIRQLLERLILKLESAGINAEVIETITSEIKAGIESNSPLTFAQIKTRLAELGVDLSRLFPSQPDAPNEPDVPSQMVRRIEALINRLRSAGVNANVITTIAREFRASIDAGSPLTLEQIRTRLTELGVDVSNLFPIAPPNPGPVTPPSQWSPPVELVTGILRRVNAAPNTIEIVRAAMVAANESGSPLTVPQILRLLQNNGVRIPAALLSLLRPFG